MASDIKPIEFYIKDVTLRDALKSGLIDKLVQELENSGVKVRFVMLVLDPVGEPGLLRIGHESSKEADEGGLHISLDPNMSERVVKAIMTLICGGGDVDERG